MSVAYAEHKNEIFSRENELHDVPSNQSHGGADEHTMSRMAMLKTWSYSKKKVQDCSRSENRDITHRNVDIHDQAYSHDQCP
jgi:hypothetical protein